MSDSHIFTSSSESNEQPKTTGQQVVQFRFNSTTYMVSPHPEHGSAFALNLQGQSMVIPVGCIVAVNGEITETIWETPFSGYPPEWHRALLALVATHTDLVIKEAA